MSENSGEMGQGNEANEQTLPGLGPLVGVEELYRHDTEVAREIVLSEEERRVLGLMRAQVARYEWFAKQLSSKGHVEHIAAVLLRAPAGPGLWEEALVALSLCDDETAHNFLEQWQPPADDAELRLFHQICLTRSRRRHARRA
ncbi:hypothetical protein FIV42_04515 [Persicimonas caeni]|uniref:Uncharacterized protein n=1 Tax=Persicimonas caeni TaxID=2292766 RepID=A0A4Y6PPJ3_PERCE|nr:hypothetical protein [Persicimonas caeni]QDG50029.1 hypothetical protein FIV42_04515 [Persicimonas caeni]QED31250.1 hypothetical protein FRD00_04510 [Persicimonas caeni]